MLVTEYGEGGYDPSKPNNNIVDQYEILDEQDVPPIASSSALSALAEKMNDPSVNTIAEVKAAVLQFVQASQS